MTARESDSPVVRALKMAGVAAVVLAGTGVGGVGVGGCQQTRVAPAGGGGVGGDGGAYSNGRAAAAPAPIMAEYAMGTLSTTLGPEVSVATLRAAAEQTLRARGYIITDSVGTADHMRIKATSRSGSEGTLEHTTIAARVTYSRTRLEIESGTFGDEAASRAIMDDLLRRLGR